jgi:hypothetical protein
MHGGWRVDSASLPLQRKKEERKRLWARNPGNATNKSGRPVNDRFLLYYEVRQINSNSTFNVGDEMRDHEITEHTMMTTKQAATTPKTRLLPVATLDISHSGLCHCSLLYNY